MKQGFIRQHIRANPPVDAGHLKKETPASRDELFISKKKITLQKTHMKLVYTTASGTANQTPLVVRLDSKNHAGKTVTVIEGFIVPLNTIEEIAKALKNKCGTGGTVKDRAIILQGDHVTRTTIFLEGKGYSVK